MSQSVDLTGEKSLCRQMKDKQVKGYESITRLLDVLVATVALFTLSFKDDPTGGKRRMTACLGFTREAPDKPLGFFFLHRDKSAGAQTVTQRERK